MRHVLLTLTLVLGVQSLTWGQEARNLPREVFSEQREATQNHELDQATDDRFFGWCDSRRSILDRAHRMANQHLRFGEYETAYAVVIDALNAALRDQGAAQAFQSSPLSRVMIQRGLLLAQRLDFESSEVFVKTKVLFMVDYLSHISQTLWDLDRQYFTSWSRCGYCHHGNGRRFDFEKSLLRFASRQLGLTNSLIIKNGNQIYPIGSVQAYLIAAEMIADFAALDLSRNLFSNFLSCDISNLDNLVFELSRFNQNFDPRFAKMHFYQTYYTISEVLDSLSNAAGHF